MLSLRSLRCTASAAALLLALAACGDSDSGPGPGSPGSPSAPSSAPTSPSTGSPPASTPGSPSAPPSTDGSGGTAADPTPLTPTEALLDWKPVPGPVRDSVTTSSAGWTLTVPRNGGGYSLEGPDRTIRGGSAGTRVSDAMIDDAWAVVVLQDKAERRPSAAEVTDLSTGRTFTIDGASDVPTTTGGTWALGGGHVLHATVTQSGAYCLASVDLPTRTSTLGWCAPKRHGFSGAHATPAGDSLLTFDDATPACRTLVSVTGDATEPFAGVPECAGWDAQLIADGAVWSVIPKENQVESAHFYARVGDGYLDLGTGTSGSLVWCGSASYFVRDPQRDGDPAALMRWTPEDGLTVAYESPGGRAFLGEPRCGGDAITVTALAEAGDEQVTASLS